MAIMNRRNKKKAKKLLRRKKKKKHYSIVSIMDKNKTRSATKTSAQFTKSNKLLFL